jgi:hypothetical protein
MMALVYIFAGVGVLVTGYAIYGLIRWLRDGAATR